MAEEFTLKYFIQDDKVYELVYLLNDDPPPSIPKNLKEQIRTNLHDHVHDLITKLTPALKNLEFTDVQGVQDKKAPLSAKLMKLDAEISEAMSKTTEKVTDLYFSHKKHESDAAAVMGPGMTIAPLVSEGLRFDEFLTQWVDPYLMPEDIEHLPKSEEEKLGLIKLSLSRLDPKKRQEALVYCKDQFLEYLKSPSSLMDLDCERWGHVLEIFHILLGQRTQTADAVFQYLHPFLRKNKQLLENLQYFSDKKFVSDHAVKIMKPHLMSRIQKKLALKKQEAELMSIDDARFEKERQLPIHRVLRTHGDFLHELYRFVNNKEVGKGLDNFKIDTSLASTPLTCVTEEQSRNAEWAEFTDEHGFLPTMINGAGDDEIVNINDPDMCRRYENDLLNKLAVEIPRLYPISVKIQNEHGVLEEKKFDSKESFKQILDARFSIDLPEDRKSRLEILNFLKQGFIYRFGGPLFTDIKKVAYSPRGVYESLTVVLGPEKQYDLLCECDNMTITTDYRMKEILHSRAALLKRGTDRKNIVQQIRVPLEPFSQEMVYIAINNLNTLTGSSPSFSKMFFS